ncbi:hypothetical protein Acr_08g0014140 [Actinidia rufa]|uniref:Tetratricopeptide repeat (TPR)-like superfamily protein n=1 Tax=Actinidia rufa TaxID=165716 RepID=A0A7J0F2V3_9ERIC|nr:hypothetical protein Acr_08g0014140 [Actinidia rufa]
MGVVSQVAPETIGSLLHSCSITKAFRHGLSYHAAVLKSGLQADTIVSNHILNLYAKCGKITLARKMFDEMPERNLVSWSAMVSGYDQAHEPRMAIELFSKMGLVPNEYVLASAVSACASLMALSQGQQIHAQSVKVGVLFYFFCFQLINHYVHEMCTTDDLRRGMVLHCLTIKLKLDSTPFIGNVIITMYSKFNMIEEAEKAFRLIVEKDVISWNTIIAACCHSDDHAKGLSIFKEMANKVSLSPDDFTYASALSACAGFASIRHGEQIHAHLIRTKLYDDVGVDNALVNMYAKCGCLEYAYTVFNQMGCHNLVSWNSIIAGFGNHGHGAKAVELFERMKEIGLKPDSITFVALLTACNHAGLVDEGQAYFNSMNVIYGIAPGIEHFSCLIDLLGRAGRLNEAEEYMEKFPFGHDQVVLGSLLSACRMHGDVIIGERLARKLLNFQPVTTSPYVLLSNLYASDGMWNCAAEARKMLKGSGLKKEPGHSLIEVKGGVEKFTISDFSHSRIEDIAHILKTLSWEQDEVFSYYS